MVRLAHVNDFGTIAKMIRPIKEIGYASGRREVPVPVRAA